MKGLYPLLWRWHFIIGLLAAPVLITVSITGALYVFEPQLEPMLEPFQRYTPCEGCQRLPYSELAAIGHAQRPEWHLHELVEPGPGRSVQVQLENPADDQERLNVFLDPYSGEVLHQRGREAGLFPFILRIHRTLLSGEVGRYVTELVVSWVFVTLLLGLLLWWPRRAKGGGGWWPRLRSKGRRFWRDLHSVTGFYLLPLALLITFTGLFFSPLSNQSMLGGMYLADQLPALFLKPPRVSKPPPAGTGRLPMDALIEDFLARNDTHHFDIHVPEAPGDAAVISTHVAYDVWHLRQAHYDPYSGELLGELRWEDIQPGARALLLFFPLHTGNIFGLGTQILACLAALLMTGISVTGIVMWWQRRRPGQLGLPEIAGNQRRIPWPAWLALAPLAVLFPVFGVSLLILLAGSGLQYLKQWRRKPARRPVQETGGS